MSEKSPKLDQARWTKLSLAEQIGNIGSEFSRARSAEQRNDFEKRQAALERALDLIDLSLVGNFEPKRRKELARLRALSANCYVNGDEYETDLQELEEYTYPFALLARK